MALAALALWLIGGVTPGETARYVAYEAAFVIAPGWLLLRVISPGTHSVGWQLALGWPLGLVLEIACFALSAWLDVRTLFLAYPLAVGIPCALLLWRRSRRGRDRDPSRPGATEAGFSGPQRWTIAGLCVVGFAYLGLTLVAFSPLPGTVASVVYPSDLMFHIAVAAEAKHHWPVEDPLVTGGVLHYHYFFHLHAAAVSQVTGIELPVLILRLCVPPLLALLLLQLSLAGRALSGIGWAGPVTAGLGLLAWELDLTILELYPFFGINDAWVWVSPSYVLGLVFFVPLAALIAGVAERRVLGRIGDPRDLTAALALIALLLLGAGGSKVVGIPVLAGGAALFLLWRLVAGRPIDRGVPAVLVLCAAIFAAFLAVLYSGGGGSELTASLGGVYELMPSLSLLEGTAPDGPAGEVGFWALGFVATTLLHFGPALLGLYWVLGRGRPPLRDGQVLLLCILIAGLPAWFLLVSDNADNNYFTAYAVVAVLPVAAEGLCRGVGGMLGRSRTLRRRLPVSATAWVVLLLAVAWAGWELTLDGHPARAYALVYGALVLGLLGLFAWARSSASIGRGDAIAVVALGVALAAALNLPLDAAPTSARRTIESESLYVRDQEGYGLTPAQVEAATWIRDQTDEDAVLAISNEGAAPASDLAPLRADLPALAERRSFHEAWVYSRSGLGFSEVAAGRVLPHPDRARLQARVFERADERALGELAEDHGVTHLVIDRNDGPVPASVYALGELVFSNGAVDVIELP